MVCFLYKDLSFIKDVPKIIKESQTLVGAILLILCCALGLTNYLVDEEVPMQMLNLMKQFNSGIVFDSVVANYSNFNKIFILFSHKSLQ